MIPFTHFYRTYTVQQARASESITIKKDTKQRAPGAFWFEWVRLADYFCCLKWLDRNLLEARPSICLRTACIRGDKSQWHRVHAQCKIVHPWDLCDVQLTINNTYNISYLKESKNRSLNCVRARFSAHRLGTNVYVLNCMNLIELVCVFSTFKSTQSNLASLTRTQS